MLWRLGRHRLTAGHRATDLHPWITALDPVNRMTAQCLCHCLHIDGLWHHAPNDHEETDPVAALLRPPHVPAGNFVEMSKVNNWRQPGIFR